MVTEKQIKNRFIEKMKFYMDEVFECNSNLDFDRRDEAYNEFLRFFDLDLMDELMRSDYRRIESIYGPIVE
jgi:hypothetical protein